MVGGAAPDANPGVPRSSPAIRLTSGTIPAKRRPGERGPNVFISLQFVISARTTPPLTDRTGKRCLDQAQQILPSPLTHCRFSFSGSMMNCMSFSETIFLFFLALVIFGPKKLPEIARQIGKYMNEFKRASNEFKAQIEQEISHLEVEQRQTILPPSPTPEGATS